MEVNADGVSWGILPVQGNKVEIGGYYRPDRELAKAAMRPSATLNALIG